MTTGKTEKQDDLFRKELYGQDLPTFDDLARAVRLWAQERGIYDIKHGSSPEAQMLKLVSEIGELADGIAKGDMDEIVDGIGDALVVIINLCVLTGLSPDECLLHAYNEIKDRRGHMVNGVFVKDK